MGSACSRVGMVRTGAGSSTNASPEMTTTPLTVHSVLSSTRDRSRLELRDRDDGMNGIAGAHGRPEAQALR